MKRLAKDASPKLQIPGGWGTETLVFQKNQASYVNHSLEIWYPADADAVVEQQIQLGNEQDPFWCYLWPTARTLAQQVFEVMPQRLDRIGKRPPEPLSPGSPSFRVLETGCGIGLVGLAALAAGETTVTFQDLRSQSVELALHNARVNGFGDRASGETFDWRSPPPQGFDWILASDVLYHTPAHADLLNFLSAAIRIPPRTSKAPSPAIQPHERLEVTPTDIFASTLPNDLKGTIWIGDPGRREADAFIRLAQARFQVTLWNAEGKSLSSPHHGQYQLIVLRQGNDKSIKLTQRE